jgi:hypothetical protein
VCWITFFLTGFLSKRISERGFAEMVVGHSRFRSIPTHPISLIPYPVEGSASRIRVVMRKKRILGGKLKKTSEPLHVRLPGFISDKEVGLGEVIKRVTYAVGFKPCAGCDRRAAALNRRIVFTK